MLVGPPSCLDRESLYSLGAVVSNQHHACRSTRNQRIERVWVDVGEGFVRRWRVFFTRLEHLHGLDALNPSHLWLLQELFLEEINGDAEHWTEHWNTHAVSGSQHNQTPSVSLCLHCKGSLQLKGGSRIFGTLPK